MYVACSSLCFGRYPLERALATVGELRFGKVDMALHESGGHLKPSEVAADVHKAAAVLRASNLAFAAFHVVIDAPAQDEYVRQLRGVCRLSRMLAVPLLTIPAAPLGSDLDAEAERLKALERVCREEGLMLTVETHRDTLTADPAGAVELCRRVPGLGLTLDPSHYVCNPQHASKFDVVYPFVRHVRLRDSGPSFDEFQVRVGQGEVEYGRIITQLTRHRYDRFLSVDVRDTPAPGYPMEPEVRKLKYLLESLV